MTSPLFVSNMMVVFGGAVGWRVDWPASDRNFIWQLRKQTNINANPREKIIEVGAEELFLYPFAYLLEVGSLRLSDAEAANLREYLFARRVPLH